MSELSEAINEMRNMRESYDQIGAAAEAYNTGKTELAENITAKGIPASATETLPELAEKVMAIAQESYTIDGGEMYAKQLFGVANNDIVPGYWNLYDILAQLLSDGRLVCYGGILLAEYYKGYDSLALSGAGAGGAYVVSDKDENGQFKMYTEDATHTWATEFDGKGNRWVAYCFADEYHNFQITDTNTSPRSIFIGRKVGTINCLVNTRISQIVVTDGNELVKFNGGTFKHNFGQIISLVSQEAPIIKSISSEKCFLMVDNWESPLAGDYNSIYSNILSFILKANRISARIISLSSPNGIVIIDSDTILPNWIFGTGNVNSFNVRDLVIITEECSNGNMYALGAGLNIQHLLLQYKVNDKSKSVNINFWSGTIADVELQDGWCKPLTMTTASYGILSKENVQAHIFDRLGVNDLSTGAVTITLANAVLNLFTQEEIDAVVARTNITIVGA